MRRILSVPPITVPAGTRDARYWPFTSDSPMNRPIGSGAVFVDHPVFRTWQMVINSTSWSVPVALHNPSYPLVSINYQAECNQGASFTTHQLRMASGISGALPTTCYRDGWLAAIDQNGNTYNYLGFVRTSDTTARASFFHPMSPWRNVVTGSGCKPDQGWAGAAHVGGFDLLTGLLRSKFVDEIAAGTRGWFPYPLAVCLPDSLLKRPTGDIYTTVRWPAIFADGGYTQYTGTIHMGSLIALPPSFNVESQSWSGPSKAIARTLQKYGCYVGDRGGNIALYAEPGANETVLNQMRTNLSTIRDNMKVVDNNYPSSIGGGGTYPAELWPLPTPYLGTT